MTSSIVGAETLLLLFSMSCAFLVSGPIVVVKNFRETSKTLCTLIFDRAAAPRTVIQRKDLDWNSGSFRGDAQLFQYLSYAS
jgi:hypothetical protein